MNGREKSIYLCGPISGMDYQTAALGWRKQVYDALTPHGIECYSPMRGKNNLLKQGEKYTSQPYNDNTMATKQGILGRDRADTTRASMIFCNLIGATERSIGSMVEFGWADICRIPILLCMENEGNPHEHLFVDGLVTYRVNNIEEGIYVAKKFLMPGID